MRARTGILRTHCACRLLVWVALTLASTAFAHDYWFEDGPDADTLLLFRGHRFSDHAGAIEPYSPEIVRDTTCIDGHGELNGLEVRSVYPLPLPADCAGLFIVTESGTWTETADGTFNGLPENSALVIDSWNSLETIKHIDSWHEDLSQPISGELEIVTLENPFDLEPGKKARLLVTLDGQPLENALVAYHGDIRGQTDSAGQINIRIRHSGPQVIAVSTEEIRAGESVRRLVRTSTLLFELD